MQVLSYVLNALPFQRNGAAAPFPEFASYHRVRIVFQPTHEVAAVLINQDKPAVLEISQIK
jgi:hypothetical protein